MYGTVRYLAKKGVRLLQQSLYFPDFSITDFFLFPKLKKFAGVSMTPGEFRNDWCRLLRSTTVPTSKEEFIKAFLRWQQCCKVYRYLPTFLSWYLPSGYIEKKIRIPSN